MNVTTGLVSCFTRVCNTLVDDPRTDAELVLAYAETRCETAFTELVRRFAPMVWGVCRRMVCDRQHAEDAFQAVFLVFVRKATSIRPPAAVGGWLHAVAVHTSLRARAMASQRQRREALRSTVPDRPATETTEFADPDLLRWLDDEIARLPATLRSAVLLCELDGVSRRDAAMRLGLAEGTLSSRLAAARKRLANRLRARGVTLGAGGIAALASGGTADAVPPVTTIHSHTVSLLAEGAIRMMFLSKLARLTASALVTVILFGVGLSAYQSKADEPRRVAQAVSSSAPVPVLKATREGHILIWVDEKPLLIKPDGTELPSPEPIPKVWHGVGRGNAELSPDGKRVAFHRQGAVADIPKPANAAKGVAFTTTRNTLTILDLSGKEELKALESVHLNAFYWLGDGKTLFVRGQEIGAGDVVNEKVENWIYDPATNKRTLLKVPEDFVVRAIAPNGKTTVVDEWKMSPEKWHQHAHLWTIGTEKPTPLLKLNQSIYDPRPVFSLDGKRLLCHVEEYGTHTSQGDGRFELGDFKCNDVVMIDLATKKRTIVKELGETPEWRIEGLAWSPDGKKIAYAEAKRNEDQMQHRVIVADPDGKNAKEIYKLDGRWLVGFGWK